MNGNIYYECRKKAAQHNERLNSRAGAAEFIGISESQLAHYELGITKNVPVDCVVLMADLYGCPELKAHYCKNECPIGCDLPMATKVGTIEEITVQLLNCLDDDTLDGVRKDILKIAADGKVDEYEKEKFCDCLEKLKSVSEGISALVLFAEKAMIALKV